MKIPTIEEVEERVWREEFYKALLAEKKAKARNNNPNCSIVKLGEAYSDARLYRSLVEHKYNMILFYNKKRDA